MVGCWENLTNRENGGDQKSSLSEHPIVSVSRDSRGEAGLGQVSLVWAQIAL